MKRGDKKFRPEPSLLSLAGLSLMALFGAGCSISPGSAPSLDPAVSNDPPVVHVQAGGLHPLPFKGRLVSGNPNQLPPAIAMSLTNDSQVTFWYREELTHDEHHPSTLLSAIDPLTYLGRSQGEYGVTAVASLTIYDGTRMVADYTARQRVTKSYGMFSQPTHRELDDEARAAVREEIDQKLYSDSANLAASVGDTE